MTWHTVKPWMALEELMALPLHERIREVRMTLASPRENARKGYMSLDDFAAAVGAPDRQGPIRWEKGGAPRDYAERIAALTPYPPAAFGAPGEAELVRETLGSRLRAVEDALDALGPLLDRLGSRVSALEQKGPPRTRRGGAAR